MTKLSNTIKLIKTLKISFEFALEEFWIGFTLSKEDKWIIICLIPCCMIILSLKHTKWSNL